MTILLVAVTLLLLFLAPILWEMRAGGKDVFSPVRITCGLHILTIIPFLLLAAFDEETISPLVRFHPSIQNLPGAVAWYGLIQGVAFVALMIGIVLPAGRQAAAHLPVLADRFTRVRSFWAVVFSSGIGVGAFLYLLNQVGGYSFLVENTYRRAQLLAGMGYVYNLLFVLSFGVLVLVYRLREGRSLPGIALALAAGLATAVIYSSFGGRRSTLDLLLAAMLVWHFGVRRIRRFALMSLVLTAVVVPYFIAIPLLRTPDAMDRFRNNPAALGQEVYRNLDIAVRQLSYVDQYILIVNHFSLDRAWLGRSYLDLLTAPIPSSRMPNKPPVDDGVYVSTIATGQEVTPPAPANDLFPSSWPPETLGIMYMNFWIPGVVFGMLLLGVIYRLTYEYMRRSQYTLFSVIVYNSILLNFHLSNLRLVGAAMNLAIALAFFGLFFGMRRLVASSAAPTVPGPIKPLPLGSGMLSGGPGRLS